MATAATQISPPSAAKAACGRRADGPLEPASRSRFSPMIAEAMACAAAGEACGYDEDDEWLGLPYHNRRDALIDAVHLGPCISRDDAVAKLDAILADLNDLIRADVDVSMGLLRTSIGIVRAHLTGEAPPSGSNVQTRRQHFQANGHVYEGERSPPLTQAEA